MKTSRAQKINVLTNQRVVKRYPSFTLRRLTVSTATLLSALFVFFLYKKILGFFQTFPSISSLQTLSFEPKDFIFRTHKNDHSSLNISDAEALLIRANIDKLLHEKKKRSLEKIAQDLSYQLDFESISLFLDQENRLHITPKKHVPIALLMGESGSLYLSERGSIYQTYSYSSEEVSQLIKVYDLKNFNKDSLIKISDPLIHDLLGLFKSIKTKKLNCHSIHFDEFRGFSIYLKYIPTQFVVGFYPYETKIKHLSTLIREAQAEKKDFNTWSVVELDYEGKAFISEKESIEQNKL